MAKANINRDKIIIEAYASGISSPEIGRMVGMSARGVLYVLRRNGQTIRPTPGKHNLIGQKFNKLVVIKESEKKYSKSAFWVCRCECGNEIIVRASALKNGHTKSCGCYKLEGLLTRTIKHGMTRNRKTTPEYYIYQSAKQRAKEKGLPFNLELSDIIIPEYCPVFTDMKLDSTNGKTTPNSPNLDRIVPELGYVKGNVRIISYKANMIKSSATNPEDILKVAIWLEQELDLMKRLKVVNM